MDMMQIRRMVMQSADGIPPIYKRVEYITGVGTGGVIDSGIPGNNDNLRFVFCFEINGVYSYAGFFGNSIDEDHDSWRLLTYSSTTPNGFFITRNRKQGSSGSLYALNPSDYSNRKLYFDISHMQASLITDTSESTRGEDMAVHGTENNDNIAIGSHKLVAGATSARRTKWYYFRIYDGSTLIRNYVPCYRKSDNKVGFYDTVNHTFNPSIGSTDFILPT